MAFALLALPASAGSNPEVHRIKNLPGLPAEYTARMYAGHVSITEPELQNNGSLFYWFCESQSDPDKDPLIIWLNGGPGCSSLSGLFMENGPFSVKAAGHSPRLLLNPHSWNKKANVLYIDQPMGTGLSLVAHSKRKQGGMDYAQNQREVNIMFMKFLENWLKGFPRFRGRDLYFSGESFAGHYIPHFASAMLADPNPGFNLKGLMIGNGWTHPVLQMTTLPQFAYNMGFISKEQRIHLDALAAKCLKEAKARKPEALETCKSIFYKSIIASGSTEAGYVNVYDVTLYQKASEPWPASRDLVTEYMNNPLTRLAIHSLNFPQWDMCNMEVHADLEKEQMYGTLHLFPAILARIPILIYNGQWDLICNHLGTEEYLRLFEWSGMRDFALAPRGIWEVDGRTAGYVKSAKGLTYLLILGGSHMVPMDKPRETYDMIQRFIRGKPFNDTFVDLGVTQDEMLATLPGPKNPIVPDVFLSAASMDESSLALARLREELMGKVPSAESLAASQPQPSPPSSGRMAVGIMCGILVGLCLGLLAPRMFAILKGTRHGYDSVRQLEDF